MSKISIRFFDNKEVRAVWDDENFQWRFSVVDIVAILSESTDARNYWYVLKNRLKKYNSEVLTKCKGLKLVAPDGKLRLTDTLDDKGIILLAKEFPSKKANKFIEWFIYGTETIDSKSKIKAYSLFESGVLQSLEPGSIKCLQQIHAYLFGGLYDFAGQIRTLNISKGGFCFAPAQYLDHILKIIENMPEMTFDEIINKYVEMNVAHPFMEGNGRSARIWLDLMLKRTLKKCVDWSKINKYDYLNAMTESVVNNTRIKSLIENALTNKINDREMFMKGIDYSYYYEEE
ncbi:Fic family protein [Bacteroidales bacterium OttesenSCG-928-I21]|nr:Fic family protein [Bacteroidales bacterium OttesenSCG-928-I21]